MPEPKPYTATNENLMVHGLAPTFRWLIAAALDGTVMTYGDIKEELEDEVGFSTIFTTRIGFVAGALMETIQAEVPDAPLINVLVVNQSDRQPSKGAGGFMADRFNEPRLAKKNAKQRFPDLWARSFKTAADEVYSYSAADWTRVYRKTFNQSLTVAKVTDDRGERNRGNEKDGIPTGRKYGPGGEGEYHRSLRLWIIENPEAVNKSFSGAEEETEVDLDSGDRIDVVYKCADRIVLLEVKSRTSNEIDLRRGVYQCIKYRAVRSAMDVREDPLIETYLVTEMELPGQIAALIRLHKIKHFLAPRERK